MREISRLLVDRGYGLYQNQTKELRSDTELDLDTAIEILATGRPMSRSNPQKAKPWEGLIPRSLKDESPLTSYLRVLRESEELASELLLNFELQDFTRTLEHGSTILHQICFHRHVSQLRLIVAHFGKARCKELFSSTDVYEPLVYTAATSSWPNLEILKLLIDVGVNLDVQYNWGDGEGPDSPRHFCELMSGLSAVHYLAVSDHYWATAGLELLLSSGALPNVQDSQGRTPLHMTATFAGGVKRFKILLQYGADLTIEAKDGTTVLDLAVEYAPELIPPLMSLANDTSGGKRPLIHQAIRSGNVSLLRMLLENGANPNVRDVTPISEHSIMGRKLFQATALHVCGLYRINSLPRQEDIHCMMEILVEYGADRWAASGDSTVLHKLAEGGGYISPLLQNIDINHRDALGRTLIMAAARSTCRGSMKRNNFPEILKYKPDLSLCDNRSQNILHHLMLLNYQPTGNSREYLAFTEAIDAVIDKVPIHAEDANGKTALHLALEHNKLQLAMRLLDMGISVGADRAGRSPLHLLAPSLAIYPCLRDLWERLLSSGCSLDARDANGCTPIFYYLKKEFQNSFFEASLREVPPRLETLSLFQGHMMVKNNAGQTPLHLVAARKGFEYTFEDAKWNDSVEYFKLLLKAGLDPREEDNNLSTPLDIAAMFGNQMILDLFAEKTTQ